MAIITSSEVKNAAFEHTTFRGYNPEQVDRILDNAAETIDSLTRENAVLNEKVRALTAQVDSMRTREGSLNEIMLRAQKMHDDIIREANEKSTAMLSEAEKKSNELLKSAKALGESKVNEYKDEIRIEKARLSEAREEAANFIDMICGELIAHTELIAKIKTRAHIEDVEPRPTQFVMPKEEDKPVTVVEAEPVVPEQKAEELKTFEEPAVAEIKTNFDFSAVVDAAQKQAAVITEEPAAPAPIVDDIAAQITEVSAPAAPTAGMSWDEIIGLKSSPKAPKKEPEDDSTLKFGKEFDITIQ